MFTEKNFGALFNNRFDLNLAREGCPRTEKATCFPGFLVPQNLPEHGLQVTVLIYF